jgi:hypothetical protein
MESEHEGTCQDWIEKKFPLYHLFCVQVFLHLGDINNALSPYSNMCKKPRLKTNGCKPPTPGSLIFNRAYSTFIHPFLFYFYLTILLLYWQRQGEYIVTFTKVLTMYCSWNHPLHHFPYFPQLIPRIVSTCFILLFLYIST